MDDVISKLENPPVCVRKPEVPLSIDDAIALIRSSYEPVKNVALTPLEAASAGLRFSYRDKDGKVITINPEGKHVGKMKATDSALHNPNADQRETLLNNIIKAVIANEGTNGFSVDTLFSYSRVIPDSPLTYEFIADRGAKLLEQLANENAIRCVNNFEKPFTYAK